jgi:uncharacterized DUF497 family protein
MEFEWDEKKNTENIHKHGLDFTEAVNIFQNPLLMKLDTRHDYTEERYIGIGTLNGRIIVIIYTKRGNDKIRVISLRKANSREKNIYEKAIKNKLEAH